MKALVTSFVREEEGQDLIEYTLILAFVALAAVALMNTMSESLTTIWSKISGQLNDAATQ
jgi:Flp pilus assembly pilin Flp